jgi:hypothetical protein
MPGMLPQRPVFNPITDKSGNLKDPFKADLKSAEAHTVSTNMSPWTNLQNKRINDQANYQRDQLSRDTSMGIGSGVSNLAASGGLDSGARERMMQSAQAQRLQGNAGVGQAAANQRSDTAIQAEMMKRQGQQFNAQALNQNSQYNAGAFNQNQAFNAQNAIGGVAGQNAFNNDIYAQDMTAWGAKQTSDAAMAAANKQDPGLLGVNTLWSQIGNARPSNWNVSPPRFGRG